MREFAIVPYLTGYILAFECKQLCAFARGVGVFGFYEIPPLGCDGDGGECEEVGRKLGVVALCRVVSSICLDVGSVITRLPVAHTRRINYRY